jgi:hypothetical protein
MALIVCPLCVREDDVFLVRTLPDGRKEAECRDCNFTFVYGSPTPEANPVPRTPSPRKPASKVVVPRPLEYVVQQFPKAADVRPDARERAEALKQEFLTATAYEPDPHVAPHWAKFRWVFSADGLEKAVISDLKLFADDQTGASTGDPTEFDKAWILLGEFEGARRVRAMTNRLLRGPGELEDRMTDLINGDFAMSMPGWSEALLTKTLSVVEPTRFLTIVTYDQKRAMASAVYGLDLPGVDETSWTIGRLAVWSNDLLVGLLGDGLVDQQHAAQFLWWAKDQ